MSLLSIGSVNANQCKATAKSTGKQCRKQRHSNLSLYCRLHDPEITCKGFTKYHKPCNRAAKQGFLYCCAQHDPKLKMTLSPAALFRDVRSEHLETLYNLNQKDAYSGVPLPNSFLEIKPGSFHVDHIVEKQVVCYADSLVVKEYDAVRDVKEDREMVLPHLNDIINGVNNLAITDGTINILKGVAHTAFIDDCLLGGARMEVGLTGFLLREKKLSRDETRAIAKEVKGAMKRVIYSLDENSDDSAFGNYASAFQKTHTRMNL